MKFEDKMKRLETLVADMEGGQMSLDDMITAFEEGRRLVEDCTRDLDAIRLKIDKITASGAVESVPVDETGDVRP